MLSLVALFIGLVGLFFLFFYFNNVLFYFAFLSFLFFFFPFLLRHVADRVLVIQPGVRPKPLKWES